MSGAINGGDELGNWDSRKVVSMLHYYLIVGGNS
jgi:hypothetical protein